jgi:hypothetical protein
LPARRIDHNALTEIGVAAGGISVGKAQFSGSLRNMCAVSELKMEDYDQPEQLKRGEAPRFAPAAGLPLGKNTREFHPPKPQRANGD